MLANNSITGILQEIAQELKSCGIEDASLEASLIVDKFSGFDRLEQWRHPEHRLSKLQCEQIQFAVEERCKHKPLAQILGEVYFYGYPFYVNADVLTPRADTEILVEAVLKIIEERYAESNESIAVLDSCTGSGCIAISIWLETRKALSIHQLDLCDYSEKALKVARRNAERHSLPGEIVSFYCSDLWPETEARYDVITCNPPYINQEGMAQLMPEVAKYEPRLALFGGRDGLDFYRRLAAEAKDRLLSGGILALEHAYNQREVIKEIFADSPFKLLTELDDYGGNARVLIFELTV
ncbi:MAG: peptide chain release factor N(5)-glutamine methyltransferase [Eubacteriales bacterium]|nr:peptide chain release factor N(5)-glutamine methyltransferase [Eubacteriales bacterium]